MEETRYSFCRLCEGACGLKLRVDNDRITAIEPDHDNPLSRGFICVKGARATEILDDPRRVLHPMHRTGADWTTASWDEALTAVAGGLNRIRDTDGPDAIALYIGNPTAMSSVATFAATSFLRSLGSTRQYSAMSLDNINKFWVAEEMFGDKSFILQRDWEAARYMLVLGHNPRVSIFGQLATRPRGLEEVRQAQAQGGRLVLVDPRRTETASIADEHLGIVPSTDVFFLLALLNTIIEEKLQDAAFISSYCKNFDDLAALVRPFTADGVAGITGLDADTIRRVAREFAAAPGAFAVGNTGVTQQRFAVVNEWAIEALNAITGNIDRPGGVFFNPGVVDEPHAKRVIERDRPSRIGGYARILGEHPVVTLADEILTPGDGQIKALIVTAGNPLATGADVERLRHAFATLELLVVIDLYRSPTAAMAHWLLPATTFFERKDTNIQFTRHTPFPFIQYTDRIVRPRGEAREEWEIFRGLHAGVGTPFLGSARHEERAAALGVGYDLEAFYEEFLARRGKVGLAEVKAHPHGLKLGDKPIGVFRRLLDESGRKIDLAPKSIGQIIPTLHDVDSPAAYPLRLISRRALRSVCSWAHFAEERNQLEISPADASARALVTGESARIRNATGAIITTVKVTDRVRDGVVSLQYGLARGVRAAGRDDEVTMNVLVPSDSACDPLTGMPTFNGIAVEVERTNEKVTPSKKERIRP
ncbi:MAG: molybdopterin-containing oxidoreductase family protein [Stellaceae bacterium]